MFVWIYFVWLHVVVPWDGDRIEEEFFTYRSILYIYIYVLKIHKLVASWFEWCTIPPPQHIELCLHPVIVCNRNPRRLKHNQQMSTTYQHDMVIHGLESDVSQQKPHCMILDLCLHHLSPSFAPRPPRPATSVHFVDMYWCNGRRHAKQHLLSAQLTNVVPCRQIGGDWRPENWEAGITRSI